MSEFRQYIGYHATPKENEHKISEEGLKPSTRSNLWMGPGIYFYENDMELAKRYVRNTKDKNPNEEYSYFKSIIKTPKECVMDLTDPADKDGHNKLFYKICQDLSTDLNHNDLRTKYKTPEHLARAVFKVLVLNHNCRVIRQSTYTATRAEKDAKWFYRIPNGVELCVKYAADTCKTEIVLEF